jgi:HEAT repeat protein
MLRTIHAACIALLVCGPAAAHGGAYRGPGGGPPSGGAQPPADSVPSSDNPPRGSQSPRGGGAPDVAAPSRGFCKDPAQHRGPSSNEPPPGDDLTAWQLWWGYNQAAFVDVKAAVHTSDLIEGSDAFFLGHLPADAARDRLRPRESLVVHGVVPALRRTLAQETDNDLVTGALIALAKIGDRPGLEGPRTADVLRPFLQDANQEIAETAAVSLGILGEPDAALILAELLADSERGRRLVGRPTGVPARTRAFAAYGLGLIGRRVEYAELAARIAAMLCDGLEAGRELATPDVAVACVSALGLVVDDAQATATHLLYVLEDDAHHDYTRAHAAVAIARLLAATDRSDPLRRRALERFARGLAPRSSDPPVVQPALALALGRLADAGDSEGSRSALAALLEAARAGQGLDVRHFALVSLGEAGARPGTGAAPYAGLPLVRAHLAERLERGHSLDRPWAALALGVLGHGLREAGLDCDPELDRALIRALRAAKAPQELGACALACGMRRIEGALGDLLAALDAVAEDEARGFIAVGLGLLGDSDALEPVQQVVRASKYRPELLRQAAISLGLLGDKRLVPELIGMLQSSTSTSAQAAVAFGLGSIGDARSVGPLVELLHDARVTPRVRSFAAVALGIVADKDGRAWNAALACGIDYRANTVTLTDGQGAGILEIL